MQILTDQDMKIVSKIFHMLCNHAGVDAKRTTALQLKPMRCLAIITIEVILASRADKDQNKSDVLYQLQMVTYMYISAEHATSWYLSYEFLF